MITLTLKAFCGFDAEGKEKVKERTYFAPSPKVRTVRKAVELSKKLNTESIGIDDLDMVVDFVVDMFGKQFTADDVYDGVDADKLPDLMNLIGAVMGQTSEKLDAIPNVAAAVEN